MKPPERDTADRLKQLESAIAKVSVLDDEDVTVLLNLAKRERDRRVVDAWLADMARRILSRGKWIMAVTAMFYFFRDHVAAIAMFFIENKQG